MGISGSLNIGEYLCKYLEYLDFQSALSPNSLRAYSTDVLQVFQLDSTYILSGPKINGESHYFVQTNENQTISMSSEDWAARALEKLRSWDEISNKSRKRKISSLNGFLNWLKSFHEIDLGLRVDAPRGVQRKLPHFISLDECLGILNYLATGEKSPKKETQKKLFSLLYGCGLRISEACNVKWANINISNRTLKILGKGNKERLAVIPKSVCETLSAFPRSGDYLWGDKPLPSRTAYQRIRDLGKEAGLIKPLHPHALRHSYATHLLSSGSDLRVLQQLLGHESLAATELYTHLDMDQLANTMENHHPLSKK